MPGLASSIENGGLGFDYRMAMGMPDFWIKTIKEKQDDDWDVGDIQQFDWESASESSVPRVGDRYLHPEAVDVDDYSEFLYLTYIFSTALLLTTRWPLKPPPKAFGICISSCISVLVLSSSGSLSKFSDKTSIT